MPDSQQFPLKIVGSRMNYLSMFSIFQICGTVVNQVLPNLHIGLSETLLTDPFLLMNTVFLPHQEAEKAHQENPHYHLECVLHILLSKLGWT